MHIQPIAKKYCAILLAFALCAAVPGVQAQVVGVELDTGNLYQVMPDASLSLIGATGITGVVGSLEFNPDDGVLYAMTTGPDAELFRVDVAPTLDDVTAQSIGSLGIFTFEGGLAFAPDGTAYGVNGGVTTSVLFTIDLATGASTVVDALPGRHDIAGLGWGNNDMLIGLDSSTNMLVEIDPATAVVTDILAVDPAIGSIGGMVMVYGASLGFFSTAGNAVAEGTNSLYWFDADPNSLTYGVHAAIDEFTLGQPPVALPGSGLSGMAIIPEPMTLSLLGLGMLGLVRRKK